MPHKDLVQRRTYHRLYQAAQPSRRRAWNRKSLYGVTPAVFAALLLKQGCRCICGTALSDENALVDHSHETDKVRGLLCRKCNLALGHTNDDPLILRQLAAYLEESK